MLQEKLKEPDQPAEELSSELVFFDTFSHDNEVCGLLRFETFQIERDLRRPCLCQFVPVHVL